MPSHPASYHPFCQQHRVIFQPGPISVCPHCCWHSHREGWQQMLAGKQGPFQMNLTSLLLRAVYPAVLVSQPQLAEAS